MSDLQSRINQLRRSIDLLTQEAFQKINQGEYDGTNELLMRRLTLIKELVSLFPQHIDKQAMQHYLTELWERDQIIIQQIRQNKVEIKSVLSNLNKIKEYTSQLYTDYT